MKISNSILLGIATLFLCSCELTISNGCLSAEGPDIEKVVDLSNDIHTFNIDVPVKIELTEGNTQEIIIDGPENLIDKLLEDSSVSGNSWNLIIQGCTNDVDEITIYATIRSLEGIHIDGSAEIESTNTFSNIEDLDISIDGSASIELEINEMEKLRTDIDGSGELEISGKAIESNNKIDGSAKLYLKDLESQEARVDIDGSGKVEINATDVLDIKIDGSGDVCYVGQPDITLDINGSGSTSNCN